MPVATPAERRFVIAYFVAGCSQKVAAYELGMSYVAYRKRVSRIYRRHGVTNIWALVAQDADMSHLALLLSS